MSSKTPASYSFEYFSSYEDKMNSVLIGFIFMNILAILVTGIRFYFFTARNPKSVLQQDESIVQAYSFKLALYLFDIWSELMFWLLFFFCASIFIAYKLSMNAFLLLPELGQQSEAEYNSFKVVLAITLVFRLLAVLMRIVEQSQIDIYLVDFEKPNMETR